MKENENEFSENDPDPSHNEAFECLETVMKKNADPIQIAYLRRIRNMAALKRMSSLKQAKIKSYFCLNYNLWSTENDKKRKRKF